MALFVICTSSEAVSMDRRMVGVARWRSVTRTGVPLRIPGPAPSLLDFREVRFRDRDDPPDSSITRTTNPFPFARRRATDSRRV